MKCNNCGHSNRRGVKFCEECGELLKVKVNLTCPSCGFKNRKGVKFCEDCGADLTAPATPAPAVTKPPKKIVRRLTEEQSAPPAAHQTAPPVIVEVRQEKKRRLNPLWLLILLLLLLTCCFGLLLTETVEVPEFAAPYVKPYLEDMREAFPDIIDDFKPGGIIAAPKPDGRDDQGKQPVDQGDECNDFANRKAGVEDLYKGGIDNCEGPPWTCEYVFEDITGLDLDDYNDLGINYQWGDGPLREATCVGAPDNFRCRFQIEPDIDDVDFYITLGVCEEYLSSWNDWVEPEKEEEEFNCEEIKKRVEELPYSTDKVNCYPSDDFCIWFPADLSDLGLDNIEDLKVIIKDGSRQVEANCKGDAKEWNCRYLPELESPTVIFKYKDCDEVIYCAFLPEYEDMCKAPQTKPLFLAPASDDCPAPSDITFKNFNVEIGGWYSFDLINESPWEQDIFYGDLYKGNGEYWHKYECTIDLENDKRMDCGSAPGETELGTAVGTGYITFDSGVFGCAELEVPADYGTVAAPAAASPDCPSGESMCAGSCCSTGHCCDTGSGLGCYSDCTGY